MFRWLAPILITATIGLATAAAPPAPPRLVPFDEAAKDASFVKFRDELKAIIARKDASALFRHLTSDVNLSFGGDYGGPAFRKMWKPYDKDTKVWAALSLIVNNGGKFVLPNAFAAPYVYSTIPEDYDAFETLVVTNKDAVMRVAPRPNAKIVRKLDYDILTIVQTASHPQHEAGPNDWSEVKDARGVKGFVPDRDLRSPIDYRIIFENRKGKWRIQTFIAGD